MPLRSKFCCMRYIGVVLLLPVLAWAAPKVTQVRLLQDQNGKPGSEVTYFQPTDHKIHFAVTFDKLKANQNKIRFVFTGVETSAGNNLLIKEIDVADVAVNEATPSLSVSRDWPFGHYRADVFANGSKVKSISYVISPAPEQLQAVTSSLYRDNGKGGEGEQVEKFAARDRKIHFAVALNGFPMGKATIRWTYTAVKTTAGDNVRIGSEDRDVSNSPGNTLTGTAQMANGWPRGSYTAGLEINGRLLTTIPFIVE